MQKQIGLDKRKAASEGANPAENICGATLVFKSYFSDRDCLEGSDDFDCVAKTRRFATTHLLCAKSGHLAAASKFVLIAISCCSRGCYDLSMADGVLRFFFDYGAGGCLWAGDTATRDRLGLGPVDASRLDRHRESARVELSDLAQSLRDQLDFEHSGYLNPLYPPDPSLWAQPLCDHFNANVDRLLALLRQELGKGFDILDEQIRYKEDPQLDEYLAINPGLSKLNEVTLPTVR